MIVTGDDFGLSVAVNEAIENAHQKGILTTTSLMVNAPSTEDAVARAKKLNDLSVGLHLVLSAGKACLSPNEIPDLVDASGHFPDNDVSSGIRMFFVSDVKQQLALEIRAQFEAFKQTGLKLDHVNAHRHMHLHPTVLNLIIEIGKDYGLTAVRLPHEPVINELIENNSQGIRKKLHALFFMPLLSSMKNKLQAANLRYNDHVFGFFDSGHMHIDKMVRILAHIPDGTTEIYTHPATTPFDNVEAGAEDYEYEAEYKALIHPRIQRAIDKFSIELSGFNS